MTITTGPRPRGWLALLGWLTLCFVAAWAGSVAVAHSIAGWYGGLVKPALTPPNAVFGPVWTGLYTAMAVAAWLAWKTRDSSCRRRGLRLFLVQLLLNLSWTWIFFSQHRAGLALVELGLLWVAIALTAEAFWKISRVATGLMAVYLGWVTFAAYLDWGIWRLNR